MSKIKKYSVKTQGDENIGEIAEIIEDFVAEPDVVEETPTQKLLESPGPQFEASEDPTIVEESSIIEETPETSPEETLTAEDSQSVAPAVETPVEVPVAPRVQFNWNGRIYPGLFKELLTANLNENDEINWIYKLAEKGAAIKTVLQNGERVNSERIIDFAINPKVTLEQYKEWKNSLKK